MKSILVFGLSLATASLAAPITPGVQFDKRQSLPTLTLPYATYRAASYDPDGDLYVFKNIRFGAPPVGDLRWAAPAPPATETEIQDGSYGPICMQAPLKGPKLTGPGADSPIGEALDQYLAGIPIPTFKNSSEDCLFLDIYVPAKALKDTSLKLPVISWFFGGAYVFGAKDQFDPVLPFYDGYGLVQAADGNVIFVSSNYRVGTYGWLAGTTMEEQGLPNTGLYDQRAVLQWIQDHISLVGGDPTQVSAWGESAGAGSIMHHLVAHGGTQDPLFTKAVMQSPAFELQFDRKGTLEQTFQNFTALAGCAGQGLACLRAADADTLNKANIALLGAAPSGLYAVGPAADGSLIRQVPSLELASGNFYRGLTSAIFSHVSHEATSFVPASVTTDADFNTYVDESYPPYTQTGGITAAIEARYPPVMSGTNGNYTTEEARIAAVIGDSSFQCNVRYLSDAYDGINYNLQYSVTPGLHGTDLLPTFYDLNLDLDIFGLDVSFPLIPGFGSFAQAYQSYLVSHAQTGDPNTYAKHLNIPPAIHWPKVDNSGDELGGVLNAGDLGFSLVSDTETTESVCGFWANVAAAATALGGYAPPGSVVANYIAAVSGDPSANYSD